MTGQEGNVAVRSGGVPTFATWSVLAIAVVNGLAHFATSFDRGYW